MPDMPDPQRVYDALDGLGIPYEKYEHPAVFSILCARSNCVHVSAMYYVNVYGAFSAVLTQNSTSITIDFITLDGYLSLEPLTKDSLCRCIRCDYEH